MLGRKCLGVDISGDDIKVVELRQSGKKYEVIQAARIKPNGDAATALGHFLLETETYPSRVVCSLPTNVCSVKFAELPSAKPTETARMARFEAESQIPLPLVDVNWGYTADVNNKSAMRHVVIAAARSSAVDDALKLTDSAHAYASAVTISALAAAETVGSDCPDPLLIVDIGTEWTDLCMVEAGRVTACRSAKIGSKDLTEAFAHDFKTDLEEAETMKRTRGVNLDVRLVGSDKDNSAIEVWVERISEEVRRSILSVSVNADDLRPQRAILAGGVAAIPSLAEILGRRAGIPMEVADPWQGMKRSDVCSHNLRESPAAFAVATGLAMSGLDGARLINLMPRRLAEERSLRKKEDTALVALSTATVVLLIALLSGAPGLGRQKAELRSLSANVSAVQRDLRRSGPDVSAQASVISQAVKSMQCDDTSCLELLRKFSANLPRSVWLTEMSFENGKTVVLKGGSLSNSAVADAVDSLALLKMFDSISLDYSNLAKGEGAQSYEFQITCVATPVKTGFLSGKSVSSKTGIIVQ